MDANTFNALIIPALLGGVGGLTRGFIGLLKALSLRRKILWGYYVITVVIAFIIGVFTGLVFNFDPRLSLLAGYAGTDILEGIYKSFQVQKVYVGKGGKVK
jgi:fluoride ion exporter CrcB/FEX